MKIIDLMALDYSGGDLWEDITELMNDSLWEEGNFFFRSVGGNYEIMVHDKKPLTVRSPEDVFERLPEIAKHLNFTDDEIKVNKKSYDIGYMRITLGRIKSFFKKLERPVPFHIHNGKVYRDRDYACTTKTR